LNVAIYRDQLRELDADLRAGTLSPEHHEKARREIEARLLEDVEGGTEAAPAVRPSRTAAGALTVLIPLGALAIYFIVGTPAALSPENVAATGAPHAADMKELEVAVERLAARLKDNPDDTEGWIMLARSYKLFSRFPEAAQAYAVAADREPRNAALLADYADVLAMAQGRRLEGEPEKLIARALEADPRNLKALALAGTAAFEKKDYAGAVAQWDRTRRDRCRRASTRRGRWAERASWHRPLAPSPGLRQRLPSSGPRSPEPLRWRRSSRQRSSRRTRYSSLQGLRKDRACRLRWCESRRASFLSASRSTIPRQ
jgi:cytochrome c-type biogenesis protein CcmH/NrfG